MTWKEKEAKDGNIELEKKRRKTFKWERRQGKKRRKNLWRNRHKLFLLLIFFVFCHFFPFFSFLFMPKLKPWVRNHFEELFLNRTSPLMWQSSVFAHNFFKRKYKWEPGKRKKNPSLNFPICSLFFFLFFFFGRVASTFRHQQRITKDF